MNRLMVLLPLLMCACTYNYIEAPLSDAAVQDEDATADPDGGEAEDAGVETPDARRPVRDDAAVEPRDLGVDGDGEVGDDAEVVPEPDAETPDPVPVEGIYVVMRPAAREDLDCPRGICDYDLHLASRSDGWEHEWRDRDGDGIPEPWDVRFSDITGNNPVPASPWGTDQQPVWTMLDDWGINESIHYATPREDGVYMVGVDSGSPGRNPWVEVEVYLSGSLIYSATQTELVFQDFWCIGTIFWGDNPSFDPDANCPVRIFSIR